MTNRPRSLRLPALVGLLLLLVVPAAHGWGPIAHYEATVASGHRGVAPYASLPDYHTSLVSLALYAGDDRRILSIADISLHFCWSHNVQDAGDLSPWHPDPINWVAGVPVAPHYPDDGREAGIAMWRLLKAKLDVDFRTGSRMKMAARGFRAHNGADGVVHWDYFRGADRRDWVDVPQWPGWPSNPLIPLHRNAVDKWRVEHQDKERWAEYLVYACIAGPLPDNGQWFGSAGNLLTRYGYLEGVPVWPASAEPQMARIMHLGQKVYRKNRRNPEMNADDDDEGGNLPVQSVSRIEEELVEKRAEIAGALLTMNEAEWVRLHRIAVQRNWTLEELESWFSRSCGAVEAAIASLN